jgi:hypothetical protein
MLRVIRVDPTRHRLGLSLRQVDFQEDLDDDEPDGPDQPVDAGGPSADTSLTPIDEEAPLTPRVEDRAEVGRGDVPGAAASSESVGAPAATDSEGDAEQAARRSEAGVAET